jgi:gliding motility-associated lipoprotein GldH
MGTALMMLPSCSKHYAEKEARFENACWAANDTLRLEIESKDTSQVYVLAFRLAVTENYPFHNIYLRAVVTSPSGERLILPGEFILADRSGAWLSEHSGDVVRFVLKAGEGLRFDQVGKYGIMLVHFMREDLLCGVDAVGILVDHAPVQGGT